VRDFQNSCSLLEESAEVIFLDEQIMGRTVGLFAIVIIRPWFSGTGGSFERRFAVKIVSKGLKFYFISLRARLGIPIRNVLRLLTSRKKSQAERKTPQKMRHCPSKNVLKVFLSNWELSSQDEEKISNGEHSFWNEVFHYMKYVLNLKNYFIDFKIIPLLL